jgi:hypothetical protein
VAVTLKVADVTPAATATDAGAVSLAFEFVSATLAPPVGAALLRVTVQVVLAFAFRLAAAHCREETAAGLDGGAARLKATILEEPFKVAVTVGLSLTLNAFAAAVKVALVEADGTVTVAGTVRLLEVDARVTEAPVEELTLTVQVLAALGAKVVGAHARLLSVVKRTTVTLTIPATDETASESPAGLTPNALLKLMVAPLLPDKVTLTVATLPLAMVVAFMP